MSSLGSQVAVRGDRLVIEGGGSATPPAVTFDCTDIRGGMSCLIYAMSHGAQIEARNFMQIERGYVGLPSFLNSFGYRLEHR